MGRIPIVHVCAPAAAILLVSTTSCTQSARPRPLSVLMVVGGDAHDYDALPRNLARRLTERGETQFDITSDLRQLNSATLTRYDVLFFQTCHQADLDEATRRAVTDYVSSGRGLVAMHGALWSYQSWATWADMVGGTVPGHAPYGPCQATVLDPAHPIVRGMGRTFTLLDEPYFVDQRNPNSQVLVRTSATYRDSQGKERPGPEPQAWTKTFGRGRIFASTFGHDAKSQYDETFMSLLHNGILWVAGRLPETPHNTLGDSEKQAGFRSVFNGRDLSGWRGDPNNWTVENGELVGRAHDLKHNVFLIGDQQFGDFELRFWTKILNGNSGVQFRSQEFPDFVVKGYQADIADRWYGSLYSEGTGRGVLADGFKNRAEKVAVLDGWNDMSIRAAGRTMTITLNGVPTVEFWEVDPSQPTQGVIALQLHQGPPMEVRFRDIRIRPLSP